MAWHNGVLELHYGWVIVFASHCTLVIAGGVSLSLGIYLSVWMDHFDDTSESLLSFVTSLCPSIMLLMGKEQRFKKQMQCWVKVMSTGPLCSQLSIQYGCRTTVISGGILSMVGFMIASLSQNASHLAIEIGLFTGFGFGLCIMPALAMVTQYFTTSQYAIAHGISYSGVGIGTLVFPPVFNSLIEQYGWRGAVLVTSAICFHLCCFGALMRPVREPSCDQEDTALIASDDIPKEKFCTQLISDLFNFVRIQKNFLYEFPMVLLLSLVAMILFNSLVCFQLFLPKAMTDTGYALYKSALVLTVAGITGTVARVVYSVALWLPNMSSSLLMLISVALVGLSMILYPFLATYQAIMLVGAIYGFSVGCGSALSIVVAKELVNTTEQHVLAIGWTYLFEGVGFILGSFIGGLVGDLSGNYQLTMMSIGLIDVAGFIPSLCLCTKLTRTSKRS